ncbi:MAG: hypothetical protein ACTHW1_04735 [Ancrocorticia sp.]|uniref:hypothetical protein n=1 Tax=Ancrocorticia sp. TaxID=2593684 RepID=UPI003F90AE22
MGTEYYFNTRTGSVEKGKKSGWQDRMGPYVSPEEALRAYKIARERTKRADDDEAAWKEAWQDPDEDS